MRLIDADALKKEYRMGDRCEDCERNTRDCQNVYGFTRMDICSMIDDASTVYGWISVKDRLPEKNQIVIASDGEHTWDVGMYKSLCGKPSEWNWKKNTVKTVLWWMPKDGALPEPPKEEPQCPQPTP